MRMSPHWSSKIPPPVDHTVGTSWCKISICLECEDYIWRPETQTRWDKRCCKYFGFWISQLLQQRGRQKDSGCKYSTFSLSSWRCVIRSPDNITLSSGWVGLIQRLETETTQKAQQDLCSDLQSVLSIMFVICDVTNLYRIHLCLLVPSSINKQVALAATLTQRMFS